MIFEKGLVDFVQNCGYRILSIETRKETREIVFWVENDIPEDQEPQEYKYRGETYSVLVEQAE